MDPHSSGYRLLPSKPGKRASDDLTPMTLLSLTSSQTGLTLPNPPGPGTRTSTKTKQRKKQAFFPSCFLPDDTGYTALSDNWPGTYLLRVLARRHSANPCIPYALPVPPRTHSHATAVCEREKRCTPRVLMITGGTSHQAFPRYGVCTNRNITSA